MEYRPATERDIEAIAALHADSWRRNYRGTYSDEFLDGGVFDERQAAWSKRLTDPAPADDTVVAVHGGSIVGFVHTILDHDPVWGALLDNLHVTHELRGGGVGSSASEAPGGGTIVGLRYAWVDPSSLPVG